MQRSTCKQYTYHGMHTFYTREAILQSSHLVGILEPQIYVKIRELICWERERDNNGYCINLNRGVWRTLTKMWWTLIMGITTPHQSLCYHCECKCRHIYAWKECLISPNWT